MRAYSRTILSLAVLTLLTLPCWARGAVLTADATWKGEVTLTDDLLVPPGVTLTILPGTVIRALRKAPRPIPSTSPPWSS